MCFVSVEVNVVAVVVVVVVAGLPHTAVAQKHLWLKTETILFSLELGANLREERVVLLAKCKVRNLVSTQPQRREA